jgi:hypothetical protein
VRTSIACGVGAKEVALFLIVTACMAAIVMVARERIERVVNQSVIVVVVGCGTDGP